MRAIGQVRRRPVLMTVTRNQALVEEVTAAFRDDHDVVPVDKMDKAIEVIRRGARPQIIVSDLSERDSVRMHSYLQRLAPELAERIVFLFDSAISVTTRAFLDSISNQRFERTLDPTKICDGLRSRIKRR